MKFLARSSVLVVSLSLMSTSCANSRNSNYPSSRVKEVLPLCATQHPLWDGKSMPAEMTTLLHDFVKAPLWETMTARRGETIAKDDRVKKEELMSVIARMDRLDTDQIRTLLVEYLADAEAGRPGDGRGKIFVLNRYIFKVPPNVPKKEARAFGSWWGVPKSDGFVDMMWPLVQRENGSIDLEGKFGGYFGAPYYALEEFDFFRTKYGRRTNRSHQQSHPLGDTRQSVERAGPNE